MTRMTLKTITHEHNKKGTKATSYAEAAPSGCGHGSAKTTPRAFLAATEKFNSVNQPVGRQGGLRVPSYAEGQASFPPTPEDDNWTWSKWLMMDGKIGW